MLQKISYRLYPIPSYTGTTRNYRYYSKLKNLALRSAKKKKYNIDVTMDRIHELYERCPWGNTCKILELSLMVNVPYKVDPIVWFECY